MITLYVSALSLLVATLPLGVAIAAGVDAWRRDWRWPTLRCLAFALLYLGCEIAGVAAAFALWVATGGGRGRAATPAARLTGLSDAYLGANFRLQCWWARTLFRGAERIFAMHTVTTGDDAVRHGPFLLFLRHASIGDTVLPAVYIGARHGIMLRYVMKRELRWDPCLDIVGHRLPNCFVQRGSGDSAREIAAVQRLAEGLGSEDGVLIYPEGTRFSPAKRARVVARLRDALPPGLQRIAEGLRHTLPPRLGGPLGLLDHNPGADAVFCAHTGFEGAASVRDLLAGALIGREVRVAFWRVPFAQIPREPERRAEWLYEQWQRIDDWIEAAVAAHGAAPRSRALSA
jgi:1-acyl-sn-glycerol-3-phosphate acyltransferase